MKTLKRLGYTISGPYVSDGVIAYVKPSRWIDDITLEYGKRIEISRKRGEKPYIYCQRIEGSCNIARFGCAASLSFDEFVALRHTISVLRFKWFIDDAIWRLKRVFGGKNAGKN